MPINDDQLRRRSKLIGSSDSPPIVGVYVPVQGGQRTAADIFWEKTTDLEEQPTNEAMEIGNDYEEPLLRWAARELGVEIRPNVEAVARHAPFPMGANHDGLMVNQPQGLEAKTGTGTDYGAPETDQVPERVIVQCQHQMYVSELELVWVPVLIARFDRLERVMYKVTRNEPLIQLVVDRDREFWENHVLPRVPPEGMLPSLSVLRRVRRIPDTLAVVDPGLVTAWKEARLDAKLAAEEKERAEQALVAALGDAEGADYGDPKKILTYRGHSYDQVDGKALKLKAPAVWEEYKRTIDVAPGLREVNR